MTFTDCGEASGDVSPLSYPSHLQGGGGGITSRAQIIKHFSPIFDNLNTKSTFDTVKEKNA